MSAPEYMGSKVLAEILLERKRQIELEGFCAVHDHDHDEGELSRAATCYAMSAADQLRGDPAPTFAHVFMAVWPWARSWWKPKSPRRDLVRAAALIVAELERMDGCTSDDKPIKGMARAAMDKWDAIQARTAQPPSADLLEALDEACRECACSVKERDSGHRVECSVPRWREIFDRHTPTKGEGGRKECRGHPPGDGDPRDGSGRASQGERDE